MVVVAIRCIYTVFDNPPLAPASRYKCWYIQKGYIQYCWRCVKLSVWGKVT